MVAPRRGPRALGRRALLRRRLGRRLAAVARRRGDRARARLRGDAAGARRAARRSPRWRCSPCGRRVSVAWSIEPDRSWAYANRGLVYLAFALVGAFAADRLKELMFGLRGDPRRRLRLVARRQGAAVAVRGLRPHRPAARAGRLLERARAARRDRAADRALPRDAAARARDAARLRLDRRDRADLLARRRDRRGARRRGLDRALARVGGGARDARRGRAAGGGRDRASRSSLDGVTSDGQSHSTRVSDGAIFGVAVLAGARRRRRCSRRVPPPEPTPPVRRAALALVAVVAAAAIVVGATHARSWWDSFTSPTVTELPELARPLHRGRLELPLDLVEAGVATAGRSIPPPAPARARSASRTSATARRASTRRPSRTACRCSS